MKLFRTVVVVAALAAALAACFGCARKSFLPDAYYAEQMVPIYPHAELTDQMGSNSYGEGPDASWDGMAWWLKSKDDSDKIVAFYQGKLSGWQKEADGTGSVTFTTVPPDGEEGEEVYVRINADGGIQIGESVKSRKRHKQS